MVAVIGHVLHFGYRETLQMRVDVAKEYYKKAIEIFKSQNKGF